MKYGWNGILSVFLFSPSGLFDPVWCRNNKWISTIAAIMNGIRKSNAKNRVSVALSTANPPHTHWTTSFPNQTWSSCQNTEFPHPPPATMYEFQQKCIRFILTHSDTLSTVRRKAPL